jgi:hypothetical protein
MPSIEIIAPTDGQQFTLPRDPTNFQVVLPSVTVRIVEPSANMQGDALVVRGTENPASSTTKPLVPGATPNQYQFTRVLVVGAPSPNGVYEAFKVCAWAKINGNTVAATPIPIKIKVV